MRRCDDCVAIGQRTAYASRVSHTSEWEDDEEARRFVAEHPYGATLDEVGEAFALTRERIRQIEEKALRKVRMYWRLWGFESEAAEAMGWADGPPTTKEST